MNRQEFKEGLVEIIRQVALPGSAVDKEVGRLGTHLSSGFREGHTKCYLTSAAIDEVIRQVKDPKRQIPVGKYIRTVLLDREMEPEFLQDEKEGG